MTDKLASFVEFVLPSRDKTTDILACEGVIAMAKENCPYAYRKLGDVSIHCKKIEGSMDYCAYTYMCPHSKRFEVSPAGQSCKLKKNPTKP